MNNKQYKIIYWATLAGIVLFGVVLDLVEVVDGIFEACVMMEFYVQYGMIVASLLTVYLALKLIKKNPILRMTLIEAPLLSNIFFYHSFMNTSFLYLAIIGLIAYVFVYPAKTMENDNSKL